MKGGVVYGKEGDLIIVHPSDLIPEGYISDVMMTKNISLGTVTLNSPFGTFYYRNKDSVDVIIALETLAKKLREERP